MSINHLVSASPPYSPSFPSSHAAAAALPANSLIAVHTTGVYFVGLIMSCFSRPSTPPPKGFGISDMTPPLTGKRGPIADPQVGHKRLRIAFDEIAPFGQLDTEQSNFEDEADCLTVGSSSPSSSYPSPVTPKTPPCGRSDLALDGLVDIKESGTRSSPEAPFQFMKLPLSIRQRIYSMVLVIPAIICVRQKHTAFHDQKMAFLYGQPRELLPGIAYALAQFTVDGVKFRYSWFSATNINILRVSRQVHAEAKPIMYGRNTFELVAPFSEMSPAVNYKIHLFPRGYQQLVQHLVIRVRAGYLMGWLMGGGYAELQKAYAGLATLTIVFEIESVDKGMAKRWSKRIGERWNAYVKRLHEDLSSELFKPLNVSQQTLAEHIPLWINMRVLFDGERYDEVLETCAHVVASVDGSEDDEDTAARLALKRGLPQAFELFKKGGV